ncbi:hypothetical protein FKM82_020259 [Ascaphus truei]
MYDTMSPCHGGNCGVATISYSNIYEHKSHDQLYPFAMIKIGVLVNRLCSKAELSSCKSYSSAMGGGQAVSAPLPMMSARPIATSLNTHMRTHTG